MDVDADKNAIRGLFAAHAAGRLDEMLTFVHPGIIWEPEGVESRAHYLGREGTLALMSDMRLVFGDHWTRIDDLTETPGGHLLLTATLVGRGPDGDVALRSFQALLTVQDGLLLRFDDPETDPAGLAMHPEPMSQDDAPPAPCV